MISSQIKTDLLIWIKENLKVKLYISDWEEVEDRSWKGEIATVSLPTGKSWFDSLLEEAEITFKLASDKKGVSCYINIQYSYNRMAGSGSNGNSLRLLYFYDKGYWDTAY